MIPPTPANPPGADTMTLNMQKSLVRAIGLMIMTTAALLLVVLMGGSDEVSGKTWYVDDDGSGFLPGFEAIFAVGMLVVAAGIFNFKGNRRDLT